MGSRDLFRNGEIPEISYNEKMEPITVWKVIGNGGSIIQEQELEKMPVEVLSVNRVGVELVKLTKIEPSVSEFGFETKTLVSIVILCRNNLEYTKKCIKSIRENTNLSCQLVIVDNGSVDGTFEYVKGMLGPRDLLIYSSENMGFASGNNLGARVAIGEYLHFLNNDCEVGDGWLEQLLEGVKDSVMVGASIAYVEPDFREKSFKFIGTGGGDKQWSYVEGSCMFLKKEIFDFVGGFDPIFDPYLSEDVDLSFKLRKYGMGIRKIDNLRVKHYGSKTIMLESPFEVERVCQLNKQKLFKKWVGSNDIMSDVVVPKKSPSIDLVKDNLKLLIRRKGNREDVLMCTPVLKKLRNVYPNSRIAFETDYPEMIHSSLVDQIVRYRGGNSDGYDLVFDLSYERLNCRNYIDEMAACAGVNVDDRGLVFHIPKDKIEWAEKFVGKEHKKRIALHVGKSWKSKEWSLDRFKEVGKYFLKEKNCSFLCLGNDETPYLGLGKDCRGFSVAKTAALVKVADMVLGIDSLISCLAAATGTPAVVIYGCTSPDVVWSKGMHYPVWIDDLPCRGCRHRTSKTFVDCERGDYLCLDRIISEMVIEETRKCLEKR